MTDEQKPDSKKRSHPPPLPFLSALGAVPHLNTTFKHFVAFGRAHGLVPEGELDPVRELVDVLLPPTGGA